MVPRPPVKTLHPSFDPESLAARVAATQPLWVFDVEREAMVWGNEAACELWSAASQQELVERDYSSDMSEATRSRLRAYLEAFRRGETVVEQWTFYPAGAAPATVLGRASGILLDDGRLGMLFSATLGPADPDALRGVEALRHTSVMISVCSGDGERILMENPAALRVYDLTQRGAENAFLARFVDQELGRRALSRIADGETFSADVQVQTLEGRRWHGLDARRSVDPVTGEPAILLNEKDISFGKHVERQLRESQALLEERVKERTAELQLRERMASIGTLAAGIAHELNNPLAFVRANMEVLRDELERLSCPPDQQSQLLALIDDCVEGADRMTAVVNDLSSFSRPTSSRGRAVELSSVLDSAVRLAANEVRHRAKLVREYEPGVFTGGAEQRLGQVFLNLIVNAAQAMDAGSVDENSITLRCFSRGQSAIVEVEDTGPGLPSEVRQRVFDPFFTTKPVGKGTGLGLFVCQRIVHELGGSIELISPVSEGRGTRARVELRREEAPEPVSQRPPSAPRAGAEERRARVLVIDDEPSLLRAIRRLLKPHEVITVASGRAALRLLHDDHEFDLVLCDLMMPEVTGMALYDAVADELPQLVDTLVFMTGGAFTDKAREFVAAHPERCLQKPLSKQQLQQLVNERS